MYKIGFIAHGDCLDKTIIKKIVSRRRVWLSQLLIKKKKEGKRLRYVHWVSYQEGNH